MRSNIVKFLYSLLILLILIIILNLLKVEASWWINVILVILGWFLGSFIYTQFHGTQVGDLKHLQSLGGEHQFQVIVKIGGLGYFSMYGKYLRAEQYSDLALQSKLFTALNRLPGNKWIKEFIAKETETPLNVFVDDYDSPFKSTSIILERGDKIK